MLNEKKIILQTKAALFEKKEERRSLRINRFTKSDYVSFHMVQNAVCVTAAYVACLAWYVLYRAEMLSNAFNLDEFKLLLYKVIVLYLVVLALFMLISLLYYTRRYDRARKKCKEYRGILKKLKMLQDRSAVKSEG